MTDVFIKATRKKFRFPSDRGDLTVEQLWEMPLTSRNGFNLNAVAVAVNRELRGLTEESFVEANPDPRRSQLQDMLELVKHVIATKQAEAKQATDRAAQSALKEKLREAIAEQENRQLSNTPIEELKAQLAALGG